MLGLKPENSWSHQVLPLCSLKALRLLLQGRSTGQTKTHKVFLPWRQMSGGSQVAPVAAPTKYQEAILSIESLLSDQQAPCPEKVCWLLKFFVPRETDVRWILVSSWTQLLPEASELVKLTWWIPAGTKHRSLTILSDRVSDSVMFKKFQGKNAPVVNMTQQPVVVSVTQYQSVSLQKGCSSHSLTAGQPAHYVPYVASLP